MTLSVGFLWLIAAILLGGAELAAPGVFLVFLAIAAAMTGVTVIALPDLPALLQLVSFGVWSAVSIAIGRRWYRDYPVTSTDPLLNDRTARLIGEIVEVLDPIDRGTGRVRVGDGAWPAIGPDSPSGTRLRVVGARDGRLLVEPLPAEQGPPAG
ncbi:MAG: hypothetical protein B7Y45_05440 [Sphingomonas sp. 28-66-16]|nr:MAG: hypothetical protein B7Y45_05440 [Sphingomonas sp. 28-66-16]